MPLGVARQRPPSKRGVFGARSWLATILLGALLPVACTTGETSQEQAATAASGDLAALATAPEMQPEDLVDLTIYLRAGQGVAAHLEPVVREVAVTEDLPRRALEMLLEGPTEADGALEAPLPTSTRVLDLAVVSGVAHVDLSQDVVTDAESIGSSAINEVLALGALVNTLTEFPSIERVVLEVEGEAGGATEAFWGDWGLPEVLVRDESLVGAGEGDGTAVVDIVRFSDDAQEAGTAGAPLVRVAGIRVRDRLTHTSFVLELADAADPDAIAKVPAVRARSSNGDIQLLVRGVTALGGDNAGQLLEDGALAVDAEHFGAARTELDASTGVLRVVLTPTSERPYWLHTLTNPPRIILDVKK